MFDDQIAVDSCRSIREEKGGEREKRKGRKIRGAGRERRGK